MRLPAAGGRASWILPAVCAALALFPAPAEVRELAQQAEPGEGGDGGYDPAATLGSYHGWKDDTEDEILAFLTGIAAEYPGIAAKQLIRPQAASIYGRPIHELVISSDLQTALDPPESPTRPHVAFVAGIRGTEASGRELLMHFINHLCQGYRNQEPDVVQLVDTTHLHFIVSLNPDGHQIGSPNNFGADGHSFDLLTNFAGLKKDRFHLSNDFDSPRYRSCLSPSICADALNVPNYRLGPVPEAYCSRELCAGLGEVDPSSGRPLHERTALPTMEPETSHFAEWAERVPLSLAVLFAGSGGGVVSHPPFACEPFDASKSPAARECKDQLYDTPLMESLATGYSARHSSEAGSSLFRTMSGSETGARHGHMSDFLYFSRQVPNVVVSFPDVEAHDGRVAGLAAPELAALWEAHRQPLMWAAAQAQQGVRGRVTDDVTGEAVWAAVSLVLPDGREEPLASSDPASGAYSTKPLSAGTHRLRFRGAAPGSEYWPQTLSAEVGCGLAGCVSWLGVTLSRTYGDAPAPAGPPPPPFVSPPPMPPPSPPPMPPPQPSPPPPPPEPTPGPTPAPTAAPFPPPPPPSPSPSPSPSPPSPPPIDDPPQATPSPTPAADPAPSSPPPPPPPPTAVIADESGQQNFLGLSYWVWSAMGGGVLILVLALLICACIKLRRAAGKQGGAAKVERLSGSDDDHRRLLIVGGGAPDVSLLMPPLKNLLIPPEAAVEVSSVNNSPAAMIGDDEGTVACQETAVANLTGKTVADPEKPWTMEDRAAFYHLAKLGFDITQLGIPAAKAEKELGQLFVAGLTGPKMGSVGLKRNQLKSLDTKRSLGKLPGGRASVSGKLQPTAPFENHRDLMRKEHWKPPPKLDASRRDSWVEEHPGAIPSPTAQQQQQRRGTAAGGSREVTVVRPKTPTAGDYVEEFCMTP